MLPIRTILHPTDFSPQSEAAFRFAAALARDYGARVVLLHVTEAAVLMYGEGVAIPLPPDRRDALMDRLRAFPQQLAADVPVETRLEEGDPAAEILRVAADEHADVIVMGTHGLTGLARLLMGSVAEQVTRKATCPVLTLKTGYAEAPVPADLAAAQTAGA